MESELLEAVSTMYGCGMLWGDVKWRKIIIGRQSTKLPPIEESLEERAGHQRALVTPDFSNARLPLLNEAGERQIDVDLGILSSED